MLILCTLDGHTKERVGMKQCRFDYFFRGHQVCRNTFLFLHCISKKRLLNLKSHLRSHGLAPPVHEDRKSTLHNRTPHSSLQNAVSFIDSYTQREGQVEVRAARVFGSSFSLLPLPRQSCGDCINIQPKLEDIHSWDTQNLYKQGMTS